MISFEGSMTALATPFKNGALDEAAYQWLVEYQIENGIAAVVPMGTTGESVTMTPAERLQAVAVCAKAARGRVKVVAGAGSNSTAETIDTVRAVRELGVDGAMIVTPYYNKPTQAGVVDHFRQIAKAHPGFPLIAYNVPGRTGFDLLPETAKRLCELPEVVALKEATGSALRTLEVVEQCGERLTVLSGDDFTVLPVIACGGRGVISVSSNIVPRQITDLVAAARRNDLATARRIQLELLPLHRLLFVESNPIPVKMALHLMGRFTADLRSPLTAMTDANASKLADELKRLKLM